MTLLQSSFNMSNNQPRYIFDITITVRPLTGPEYIMMSQNRPIQKINEHLSSHEPGLSVQTLSPVCGVVLSSDLSSSRNSVPVIIHAPLYRVTDDPHTMSECHSWAALTGESNYGVIDVVSTNYPHSVDPRYKEEHFSPIDLKSIEGNYTVTKVDEQEWEPSVLEILDTEPEISPAVIDKLPGAKANEPTMQLINDSKVNGVYQIVLSPNANANGSPDSTIYVADLQLGNVPSKSFCVSLDGAPADESRFIALPLVNPTRSVSLVFNLPKRVPI